MKVTRRGFLRHGGLALGGLAAASAASPSVRAAGWPDGRGPASWPIQWSVQPPTADPVVTALNRAAFGPRPGDVEHVRQMGLDNWIDQQLSPEEIDDSALDEKLAAFPTLNMTMADLLRNYQTVAQPPAQVVSELQAATLLRAVYSERQLLETVVDFWSNHFSIFILKDLGRWLKTIDDREVIRRYALGNFQDLLTASAQSPAMLSFLDNSSNVKGVPNENYARELMELHTLGVDGGYTQQDVQEVARCFTGWTIGAKEPNFGFVFNPRAHDDGAKVVLGRTIPAGGGIEDGLKVIEILSNHPSTARFIATKLVHRFVADDPPRLLVDWVALAFTRSKGDIRQVMRALLRTDAFKHAFGKKAKRPFEMVASTLRSLDAASDGGRAILNILTTMGQMPFMWQAPNGYPDVSAAWINTNGILNRWNFAFALLENRLNGTSADVLGQTKASGAQSAAEIVDFWIDRVLARPMASADRSQLINYLSDGKPDQFQPSDQVLTIKLPELVALIVGSPDFQWR